GQVQCGASGSRHWHAVHQVELVALHPVAPDLETRLRVPVVMNDVDGPGGVDPFATVQRGRREPGDDSAPARPEPSATGPYQRSQLSTRGNVDIPVQPRVATPQLAVCRYASSHSLTADKRFRHG